MRAKEQLVPASYKTYRVTRTVKSGKSRIGNKGMTVYVKWKNKSNSI